MRLYTTTHMWRSEVSLGKFSPSTQGFELVVHLDSWHLYPLSFLTSPLKCVFKYFGQFRQWWRMP